MIDSITIRKYTHELVLATFENRVPAPVPEQLMESEIVTIARNGQMPYLLLTSFLKVSNDTDTSEIIREYLKRSTLKTFIQVFAARQISSAFEQRGIRHQMLKGTIMKDLYPSPEMREMSDIDLVVYDENLDNAAKAMDELGFTNHGLIKHHMIFTKGPDLMVEVHWCLFDADADKNQHMYFKDNFRAKLKEGTEYTYEFTIEDFYVYMISHMSKHFFETGCGIRNLVDIYVYMNRYNEVMDHGYLKRELDRCGILAFEENMRKLAYIWLDDEKGEPFYENLFEYMVESGIYGKSQNGIWGQLAKETQSNSADSKMRFYFPSINFMVEKYPWLSKCPYLLPTAWVIRGVTGLASKDARNHKKSIDCSDKQKIENMLEIYHRLNLNFRR